jgi:Flp pilus assembly protein TadD
VERGDLQGALNDFNQAVKLNPRRAALWAQRGLALLALGKTEEAEHNFTECLRLDPGLKPSLDARINELRQQRVAGH